MTSAVGREGRSGGASGAWHEFTDFLGGLGYAAITAVVLGAFALPLASLSSRRAVGAVVIAAAFTVTTPIIGVVTEVGGETARQLVPLVNPVSIVTGVAALFLFAVLIWSSWNNYSARRETEKTYQAYLTQVKKWVPAFV